jgi:predicted transcriptional regulator
MTKLFCRLFEDQLSRTVYAYIKANPGLRLYEIDKNTLKSHHNWGTKYIVERLEDAGKLYVKREHHGKKVYSDGLKVWPTYYAVGANV